MPTQRFEDGLTVGKFPSKSKPGKEYTVLAWLNSDNKAYLSCNCPRWILSAQNRDLQSWERTCTHCEDAWKSYPTQLTNISERFAYWSVVWWIAGKPQLAIEEKARRAKLIADAAKALERNTKGEPTLQQSKEIALDPGLGDKPRLKQPPAPKSPDRIDLLEL